MTPDTATDQPPCVDCGHRAHPGGPGTRWCTASAAPGTHCHCTTNTISARPGATDAATSTAFVVRTPGRADRHAPTTGATP